MYLSEPVNCDEKFLGSLFALWHFLQGIEGLRRIHAFGSKNAKNLLPKIAELAQKALPQATEACQKVDAAIEKMKPLGEV